MLCGLVKTAQNDKGFHQKNDFVWRKTKFRDTVEIGFVKFEPLWAKMFFFCKQFLFSVF